MGLLKFYVKWHVLANMDGDTTRTAFNYGVKVSRYLIFFFLFLYAEDALCVAHQHHFVLPSSLDPRPLWIPYGIFSLSMA